MSNQDLKEQAKMEMRRSIVAADVYIKSMTDAAVSVLIQHGLMAAIDRPCAMLLVQGALEMVAKHDQELGQPPNEGEF